MQNFYSRFLESVEKWPENVAVELRHAEAAQHPASPVAAHPSRSPASPRIEQYTYSELRRMAESVGRWLLSTEMPRGARCAVLAANGPRWVAAYLGAIAAGGVAVPLDTAFNAAQVRKLLQDSISGCLFTDSRHLSTARKATEGLDIFLVLLDGSSDDLPTFDAMLATGPGSFSPAQLGPEDPAVLLYTSGTTDDPKGVLLSHDNLLGEIEAVFPVIEIFPSDAILGVLPLFHALAQMANLLLPFARGARVVYLESLNVAELMRALRDGKITVFCCVPQFFYLIHERIMKEVKKRGRFSALAFRALLALARAGRRLGLNLGKLFFPGVHQALGPRMRMLITGGSRFDVAIGRDLYDLGFQILQAYGLTETSGGVTCTSPHRNVIGSVGPPLHGIEVKILDPEPRDDGLSEGEIAIRGRVVMQGYWNRPDATARVLRDGWLHTGDLGYLDSSGNLFITGRRKEVIVLSSGKNIYPEELEGHYARSPFIKEICILGLESRPGEPVSERLHAIIVPDYDVLRERKVVNVKEVIRFDVEGLSAQLPATKRILSYDIWQDELPRTTTRKLKRFEIRKRLLQAGAAAEAGQAPARELSQEDLSWLQQPDVLRALAVLRRASKTDRDIGPSDNLELDLGLDSMERVELLVELERTLDAHVPDSVASEVYTVREIIDAVRATAGSAARREVFAGWEAVLATESTDPDVIAVTRPRRFMPALWFFGEQLLNLLCRDLYHMEVEGLEKLPPQGPFILSPNHQSFLDAPVVWSLLPWSLFKDTVHLGTSEIWGWGWRRRLARTLNLVPVDPDSNLVAGMRAGAYALTHGKVLVLYPEGERSIDGRPKVFKKGAAILATHLRVPICPVALDGFHEAWPRGKPPQKPSRLRVRFGDPLPPPLSPGPEPEATYHKLTEELRARVVSMWNDIHEEKQEPASQSRAAAAD